MYSEFNYNWQNWAGNHSCTAEYYFEPESIEQIQDIVRKASQQNKKIRVVGSGHSFSPIAIGNEILISIKKLNKIVHRVDNLISVQGGITLKNLYKFLKENQLSLSNYGVINKQTIVGAIATGTHGSGISYKSLSDCIHSIKLIKADGSILLIDRNSTLTIDGIQYTLMNAAAISLGLLGIIAEVTLVCEPLFYLQSEEKLVSFDEYLENQMHWATDYDYFKAWWFPHTKKVNVYFTNRIPKSIFEKADKNFYYTSEQRQRDASIDNDLAPLFKKSLKEALLIPEINKEAANYYFTHKIRFGASMDILVHDETVPMIVSEYALSLKNNLHQQALKEFYKRIEKSHHLHFPVDLRFAAKEDFYLSPAHNEPVFYIGMCVREYKGKEIPKVMQEYLNIMREFNGRPNWGKISDYSKKELMQNFLGFTKFNTIRKNLDPENRFINEITEKWFL